MVPDVRPALARLESQRQMVRVNDPSWETGNGPDGAAPRITSVRARKKVFQLKNFVYLLWRTLLERRGLELNELFAR